MYAKITELKGACEHLVDHLDGDVFDTDIVKEVHMHIDEIDESLTRFHKDVEEIFFRWRRSRPMPIPNAGAEVPVGLVVPVFIDSFVDGFLIGLTCALNIKAGYILSAANCLEMAFLVEFYSADADLLHFF